MLALVRSPFWFFVSTFIWTMGEIVNTTNAEVYIANHTPMSHRGRFNAVLPFIGGFGWAISTPIGGNIIHSAGIAALWAVVFAVAALSSLSLLVLDRREGRSGKRNTSYPGISGS